MKTRKLAGTAAALVGAGALAIAATGAPADVGSTGAKTITGRGVGAVKIGKRYTDLRKQKLVGKIGPGCELAGPDARAAALKKPLVGSVDFSLTSPRKVTTITLTGGGATAKGVGIGDKLAAIQAKFPHALVDHSGESVFELTFVNVPKQDGGKIQFGLSTKTKKVTVIGIPNIAVCE
jgi:hypothetical protein